MEIRTGRLKYVPNIKYCLMVYLEARSANSQVIELFFEVHRSKRGRLNTDYESFPKGSGASDIMELTEEGSTCESLPHRQEFSFFDLNLSVSAQFTQLDKAILEKTILLTHSNEDHTLIPW